MKTSTINLLICRFSRFKQRSSNILCALLISTLAYIAVGCHRDSPSNENLLASELIDRIPDSTVAFSIVDFHGEGLKQLRASPLSTHTGIPSLAEITDIVANLPEDAAARADYSGFTTALRESELYSKDGASRFRTLFSTGILFFASEEQSSEIPHIGFFAKTPSKRSSYTLLDSLESSLKKSGFSCSRTSAQNAARMTVHFRQMPITVSLIATETHFGFSTKEEDLNRLTDDTLVAQKHPITNLPIYHKATAELQRVPNTISLSFFATRPIVAFLKHSSPTLAAKLDDYDDNNPIEAVLMQNAFNSGYVRDIRVVVTPRNSEQEVFFKSLETDVPPTAPFSFPSDTALAINVRTHGVATSLSEGQYLQIDSLGRDMSTMSLGLRNNINGSPIPDLFASLLVNQVESSQLRMKELASTRFSFAGQTVQWNSKTIGGIPVEYFTSLLGAGIYLGADTSSNSLLIASSERAMDDLIQSTHKKTGTLQQLIPTSVQEQFSRSNVCSVIIDFAKTADVLDSVLGTLSMMTGGSSELNKMLPTSEFRSFGILAGSVSYSENIFSIRSTQFLSDQ